MSPGTRPICSIKWFEDGALNVSANCIDRHLAQARRPDRHHLGRRRPQGLQSTSPIAQLHRGSLPLRQCAEGARRQKGRPRHHLYADDPGSRLCHAGLRPHRGGAFGGVRRLLARQPGRAHHRLRQQNRDHRRRRRARRQTDPAEKEYRRGAGQGAWRHQRDRGPAHRRRGRDESRAATSGITRKRPRSPPTARPRRWARKTRCSFFTPPARPESPRACCTPPPAICSGPPIPIIMCSIITRAKSTGAPPMSAG